MNLTIEQLSKATRLSVSTIRVYASQRNLGKKVRGKRVFSQADVQKLLKGSKKSPSKKIAKPRTKKVKASSKALKAKRVASTSPRSVTSETRSRVLTSTPYKASFWSRLFGGGKPKEKVSLMNARVAK